MTMAEQMAYWHERARAVSRRRALQLGAAGAASLAASPVLLGGTTACASAGARITPFGRHLGYGADPATQMRVTWQVPQSVDRPVLRLGLSKRDLSDRHPAVLRNLQTIFDDHAVNQFYGQAALDGLRPGTTYYYAVGHAGLDPADGPIHSFTTAPAAGGPLAPFTFTAVGDQGGGDAGGAITRRVLREDPRFHLLIGDISYANRGGSGTLADDYVPTIWDKYLRTIEPVARRVPWLVTTGNHDMEARHWDADAHNGYGGFAYRFQLPGNGPSGCPSVYAVRYGNVGILALDSNDVAYEVKSNRGYSRGRQTSWAEERLAAYRADPTIDFVVCFLHYCAYSTSTNHASDGGVRRKWGPLFDKYRVDLVLNGHNHLYERTDPIRHGRPTRPAPAGGTVDPATDGTVYVVAGGGGGGLYNFPKGAPESYLGRVKDVDEVGTYHWGPGRTKIREKVAWSRVRYTGHSYVAIDVVPARPGGLATMTMRTVTAAGKDAGTEVDRLTLRRRVAPRRP
ncbi:hypothetical protein GCM10010123_16430 [Pilimelia anulata]|uniref:Purple acid phosphatase n=2 Tax=Pilimelia anulata TaxID=53371 RepID=A0A8J3F8B9_9ACTN|nr:hypothetical protein GCM10010123_16430 [Pilimelia anulata]